MTLVPLRDLPGVQRAADLCRNPRNFEYLAAGFTMEEVADISIRLFSITAWDTELDVDDELEGMTPAEYEANFQVTRLPWPESQPFWEALGWDISDGNGGELICAHLFARQIIATMGELVEGAKFTPDGSGVHGAVSDEDLETRLRDEADDFLKGRR